VVHIYGRAAAIWGNVKLFFCDKQDKMVKKHQNGEKDVIKSAI